MNRSRNAAKDRFAREAKNTAARGRAIQSKIDRKEEDRSAGGKRKSGAGRGAGNTRRRCSRLRSHGNVNEFLGNPVSDRASQRLLVNHARVEQWKRGRA